MVLRNLGEHFQHQDNEGQADEEVQDAGNFVQRSVVIIQPFCAIAWSVISETDGRQRDEAEVESLEVAPVFDVNEEECWEENDERENDRA